MKKLLIVANWKSNKTKEEVVSFFEEFIMGFDVSEDKNIIICPSFTSLPQAFKILAEKNISLKLGAQNVSSFEEGSYTGEINSKQIKEFCNYCIVGHSERRINFSEDSVMIKNKIKQLEKEDIIPILCISDISQLENLEFSESTVIAYEPVEAIGSGIPSSFQDVEKISGQIKSKFPNSPVLYGGSINGQNVSSFTSISSIDGVLVGSESLDPQSFVQIIKNA